MQRILLLSFYYPPDLSAGAFRAAAIIKALRAATGDKYSINIITTQPNRYHGFKASPVPGEEDDGTFRINRIVIPEHNSGLIDQVRASRHFATGVFKLTRGQRYDLVIATSSRLMTAMLGAAIARRRGARLYLDLRDIFAEVMPDLLPAMPGYMLKPVISLCERWTIRRADRINLVSPGFLPWFESRYPGQRFTCYTNGIDNEFIAPVPSHSYDGNDRPVTILYAGNIGEGQGLHHIIPALAKRLHGRIHFRIIGAGGRLSELQQVAEDLGNVEIIPPMNRTDLIRAYRDADVLFVHLNRYKSLLRVIPSKIFEYAATGMPIWAGVGGYAAEFIEQEISNAAVFPPCDDDAAIAAFERLVMGTQPRDAFVSTYARDQVIREMAQDILTLL